LTSYTKITFTHLLRDLSYVVNVSLDFINEQFVRVTAEMICCWMRVGMQCNISWSCMIVSTGWGSRLSCIIHR